MFKSLVLWWSHKWVKDDARRTIQAYRVTFTTPHGSQVLQHLLDNVYCTVYEGTDPVELAIHNGRRSVVHDILINIDMAENPNNYITPEGS